MRKLRPYGPIPRETIPYAGVYAREGCEIRYTVSGRGFFPEDMLRYDGATLVNGEVFTERLPNLTTVAVKGERCTPERWRSFGWTVHDDVIEVGN